MEPMTQVTQITQLNDSLKGDIKKFFRFGDVSKKCTDAEELICSLVNKVLKEGSVDISSFDGGSGDAERTGKWVALALQGLGYKENLIKKSTQWTSDLLAPPDLVCHIQINTKALRHKGDG